MTPEQKLEIVYKKLFNGTAFTKEGTKFFEEPFRAPSQVPLSYVYINSDYIPATAPHSDVAVNGRPLLTYVEKERSIPFNSKGTTFVSRNKRIIPFSYGEGYGIEVRTQSGMIIDPVDFPYIIDWESGKIDFDVLPFDVDNENPPLLTYHFYSGDTLETISSSTQQGPRGDVGPTGDTGPKDTSVLMYRGETDFTASPAVQYIVNDVITFTTNGNSYICIAATTLSPVASPSSWELITVQGTQSELPENVLFVNDPGAILTSSFSNGSNSHYSSLQDAINAAPDGVSTLILVNSYSNSITSSGNTLDIINKNVHIVFRKWANISSKSLNDVDFRMTIKDSVVTFENAQIGGLNVFGSYEKLNDLFIESIQIDSVVRFIECKINLRNVTSTRTSTYNSTMVFERSSLNALVLITNGDLVIKDSVFSGSINANYSDQEVIGKKHTLNIINSFGFQRMTRASYRNVNGLDVTIVLDRNDVNNGSFKFENSVLPALAVKLLPQVQTNNPCTVTVDANNSSFYFVGLDNSSAVNSGVIEMLGSNISLTIGQTYIPDVDVTYYTSRDPLTSVTELFKYIIQIAGQNVEVVKRLQGSLTFFAYNPYKSTVIANVERSMISL